MDYQAEIQKENGAISRLTQELKQVKIKPRTINYQFQNQGNVRGITQRVLVVKKQRKQINSKIASSRKRIMSLRESILGKL